MRIKLHLMRVPHLLITLLFLFVFANRSAYAQHTFSAGDQHLLDSLNRVITVTKDDSIRVHALVSVVNIYIIQDLDTAMAIAKRAEAIAKKINMKDGLGGCYGIYGYIMAEKGDPKGAIKYHLLSLDINKEIGNEKGIGADLINIAGCYYIMGDMAKALEYDYKALAITEKMKDYETMYTVLNNITIAFLDQKEDDKGLQYRFKCLKLAMDHHMKKEEANSYSELGSIYRNRFNRLAKAGGNKDSILAYKDKAIHYTSKAIELHEENHDKKAMRGSFTNFGLIYRYWGDFMSKGDYPKDTITAVQNRALNYFFKALKIAEEFGIKQTMAFNNEYISTIYLSQGKIREAEQYALKSYDLSREVGIAVNMKQSYLLMSKVFKAKKDYKGSLEMYEKYIMMNDSLKNAEMQKLTLKKEYEYENEKKEQENRLLSQQNQIQQLELSQKQYMLYALAIAFLLVILVSFFLIRQTRILNRQKTMKLEQRLLRSQMNPHFIFNSLTAIQSFVYKNDPKTSGKYLSSFARLVRAILENSRDEYITLSKEIQWLENYLNLQQLRFDHKFEYVINTDESLDVDSTLIPPMLSQPVIENALEHGMNTIDYKGLIEIDFTVENGNLMVKVKDNGVGISSAAIPVNEPEKEQHVSLATTIIKERLRLLNRRKFRKISFSIDDLKPSGTMVVFSIPLQNR